MNLVFLRFIFLSICSLVLLSFIKDISFFLFIRIAGERCIYRGCGGLRPNWRRGNGNYLTLRYRLPPDAFTALRMLQNAFAADPCRWAYTQRSQTTQLVGRGLAAPSQSLYPALSVRPRISAPSGLTALGMIPARWGWGSTHWLERTQNRCISSRKVNPKRRVLPQIRSQTQNVLQTHCQSTLSLSTYMDV